MKRKSLQLVSALLIVCAFSAVALAQGRGRGVGLGRKSDVFDDRRDMRDRLWSNRARVQDWKCGKFVNCHDARNGRWDGRGPRTSRGFFSKGVFIPRGSRVRHRMLVRDFDRDQLRRAERLNRLEMLRQERIAERRHFGNRLDWRQP